MAHKALPITVGLGLIFGFAPGLALSSRARSELFGSKGGLINTKEETLFTRLVVKMLLISKPEEVRKVASSFSIALREIQSATILFQNGDQLPEWLEHFGANWVVASSIMNTNLSPNGCTLVASSHRIYLAARTSLKK